MTLNLLMVRFQFWNLENVEYTFITLKSSLTKRGNIYLGLIELFSLLQGLLLLLLLLLNRIISVE